MSATEALRLARENGIHVGLSGADLILDADREPALIVLEALRRDKAGIVALLAADHNPWTAEDWRAFFDERAGIAEFDGGLRRSVAEARAFACCIVEWLNHNPVRSPPGRCLRCGGGEHPHEPLSPFGTEASGHAWLHGRCWSVWRADRKGEAAAALAALGIQEKCMNP